MDLIRIRGARKTYKNGVTAIQDLDLDIKKGEFVFVIGSTGCGKSTLIKMLYREEKPTNGKIIVGGINVGKLRNSKVYKLRRKIGVAFQDFKLLPKLTVYENERTDLQIFLKALEKDISKLDLKIKKESDLLMKEYYRMKLLTDKYIINKINSIFKFNTPTKKEVKDDKTM